MEKWDQNPNWKELPKPDVGDIVHLKHTNAFQYLVKIIVTTIGDEEITGQIEALFDYETKGPLQGGDKMRLVGKQASFRPCFIQRVIKK